MLVLWCQCCNTGCCVKNERFCATNKPFMRHTVGIWALSLVSKWCGGESDKESFATGRFGTTELARHIHDWRQNSFCCWSPLQFCTVKTAAVWKPQRMCARVWILSVNAPGFKVPFWSFPNEFLDHSRDWSVISLNMRHTMSILVSLSNHMLRECQSWHAKQCMRNLWNGAQAEVQMFEVLLPLRWRRVEVMCAITHSHWLCAHCDGHARFSLCGVSQNCASSWPDRLLAEHGHVGPSACSQHHSKLASQCFGHFSCDPWSNCLAPECRVTVYPLRTMELRFGRQRWWCQHDTFWAWASTLCCSAHLCVWILICALTETHRRNESTSWMTKLSTLDQNNSWSTIHRTKFTTQPQQQHHLIHQFLLSPVIDSYTTCINSKCKIKNHVSMWWFVTFTQCDLWLSLSACLKISVQATTFSLSQGHLIASDQDQWRNNIKKTTRCLFGNKKRKSLSSTGPKHPKKEATTTTNNNSAKLLAAF